MGKNPGVRIYKQTNKKKKKEKKKRGYMDQEDGRNFILSKDSKNPSLTALDLQ